MGNRIMTYTKGSVGTRDALHHRRQPKGGRRPCACLALTAASLGHRKSVSVEELPGSDWLVED